jgi:putative redox protein
MSGQSLRFTFPNGRGQELDARLELPVGPKVAHAIFAHCFTCSKDIVAAGRISRALGAEGIAVLRFDFTGIGNSEGDFANTDFSSNVEDLVAAADHLRRHHGAPELLVGHSLGGAAVVAVASRIPEVRAVATIGAPSDPAHLGEILGEQIEEIEARGEAKVELAGRRITITREFLRDIEAQSLERALREYRGGLMIFHSPRDEIVDIDHARRLFTAAHHPKSFVSLDDADHLLTDRADALYVARTIAAWASRYVCGERTASADAPEGVLVSESGAKYGQDVRAGRHVLRADEPTDAGGRDSGPTPYDLLLAGLGACTTMTLRMYADRKGWPLRRASARVRYARIHAKDCESCESDEGRAHRFVRELELTGPLDDAQRERLVEIADRCPVHRTLHEQKEIVTRLVDPDESDDR